MTRNREVMALGRNFPPTVLRWTAENSFSLKWTTRSLAGVAYNLIGITAQNNGSGILNYASGDGTTDTPTAKSPRNWALLSPLYQRAKLISSKIKITITVPTTDASSQNWNVYYWISSILDKDNPIADLSDAKTVGTAPWEVDETKEKSARTILDSSRRVIRRQIKSVGSGSGATSFTIMAVLPVTVDRIGNRIIGGNYVRDITNAPGGGGSTTDKTMALALSEVFGQESRLNIVCVPTKPATTTGSNIESTHITIFNHMEFYDRVLPAVT